MLCAAPPEMGQQAAPVTDWAGSVIASASDAVDDEAESEPSLTFGAGAARWRLDGPLN